MSDFLLSAEDTALIGEYLDKVDELNRREPAKISAAVWDEVMPIIKETGEIPQKYRDIIGVRDLKERKHHFEGNRLVMDDGEQITKGYYDIAWESWNEESTQLQQQYHDAILKALRLALYKAKEEQAAPKVDELTIVELLEKIFKENKRELPEVIVHKLEKLDFPIDKVNKDIWHLLDEPTGGQLALRYNVAKSGSKTPVDILYSLDFNSLDNVSITRKLEPYDKRVYLAVAALFNAGYDIMSVQQIYNSMGYKGRAGASDIKKINAAISKMSGAHLYIDNLAEVQANYGYGHFKYDAALLPMERITAVINGQTAEAAIHVFREPPMVTFARDRKQITTVDLKLLDTPLSKTNANIELEDYLIEEIARIKNGKREPKMLYKTIYEHANIKTTKQKQRAPGKIKQLLDHYKACGHISAYKVMKDGVVIIK